MTRTVAKINTINGNFRPSGRDSRIISRLERSSPYEYVIRKISSASSSLDKLGTDRQGNLLARKFSSHKVQLGGGIQVRACRLWETNARLMGYSVSHTLQWYSRVRASRDSTITGQSISRFR